MLSITLRPREHNFKAEWREELADFFKKDKYVIGLEKDNHLQVALESTKRSNNLRTLLVKFLKYSPEDDDEARHWLMIRSHKEPAYLIGYCCKETKYITNYSPEYIEECIGYYSNRSVKIESCRKNHKWACSGINNLFELIFDYATKNHLLYTKVRNIICLMFADDLIPLSLARKIDKKFEDLWIAYRERKQGSSNKYILDKLELLSLD